MHWFTADLHLGHKNIIEYCDRPFGNVDEMDAALIDGINERVEKRDTLWVVGDFTLKNPDPYLDRIDCNDIRLIRGNHDSKFFPGPVYDQKEVRLSVRRQKVFLCHYAMLIWPAKHHGAWHLFGHSHGALKEHPPFAMDVGVDTPLANYYPLSEQDICDNFDAVEEELKRISYTSNRYGPLEDCDVDS